MLLQVHGAFAGFSGITSCVCNTHYVYLPIMEVIASPKCINPNSKMWHRCLTSTGQPDFDCPVVGIPYPSFKSLALDNLSSDVLDRQ
jgi:hypothetical protein